MDQTILKNELRTTQIHKHKWTYRKKFQLICQFQFPKPLMRCIKMLLQLNENEHTLNLYQITIQIFEHGVRQWNFFQWILFKFTNQQIYLPSCITMHFVKTNIVLKM
jgi:hypothetical protein